MESAHNTSGPAPAIDSDRLAALLSGINRFGARAGGGFQRVAFSDADMAARRWFAEVMRADGLTVHTDAVGNVFGRYGPAGRPSIMLGSHLDTVPAGGAYDGALGCAVALECVRALREAGVVPKVAVEVVATADEEGRFGGMLGSQAMVGAASPQWAASARDPDGVRLEDAMRAHKLDPAKVGEAARPPGSVLAFLELHVEQGPVLEACGHAIGIARSVSGLTMLEVTFTGVANHSGTTPMEMRADALLGLADVAGALPEIARREGSGAARLTVGQVELSPNAMHTIPGRARFTICLRDTEAEALRRLQEAVERHLAEAARRHGLTLEWSELSRLAPVALDEGLVRIVAEEARGLGTDALAMPSGAGHDAQTMASLCPSALIFVPSCGGISHAPEEFTEWADIEQGARLMLRVLARLAADPARLAVD